ncbi:unnamed protein product [Phytophthora fragariaefolia]|uniref:Unnamed protein product n=1 Tax=Phytophthora fragariaefolia TaxID=1490495 RepID=A0A9W6XRG7_9STRA|nr:unnamed protein product [Phytophthora fragariaefolia]
MYIGPFSTYTTTSHCAVQKCNRSGLNAAATASMRYVCQHPVARVRTANVDGRNARQHPVGGARSATTTTRRTPQHQYNMIDCKFTQFIEFAEEPDQGCFIRQDLLKEIVAESIYHQVRHMSKMEKASDQKAYLDAMQGRKCFQVKAFFIDKDYSNMIDRRFTQFIELPQEPD